MEMKEAVFSTTIEVCVIRDWIKYRKPSQITKRHSIELVSLIISFKQDSIRESASEDLVQNT
jgi:hypothetical protein